MDPATTETRNAARARIDLLRDAIQLLDPTKEQFARFITSYDNAIRTLLGKDETYFTPERLEAIVARVREHNSFHPHFGQEIRLEFHLNHFSNMQPPYSDFNVRKGTAIKILMDALDFLRYAETRLYEEIAEKESEIDDLNKQVVLLPTNDGTNSRYNETEAGAQELRPGGGGGGNQENASMQGLGRLRSRGQIEFAMRNRRYRR